MKFVVRQLIIPFLTHILTLQSYYKYMAISKQQKLQLSEIFEISSYILYL